MPDGLIEELSKDVSSLASLVLHSARKQPTKEEQGAADKPVVQRICGT
jgi:hypothetical protein